MIELNSPGRTFGYTNSTTHAFGNLQFQPYDHNCRMGLQTDKPSHMSYRKCIYFGPPMETCAPISRWVFDNIVAALAAAALAWEIFSSIIFGECANPHKKQSFGGKIDGPQLHMGLYIKSI